MQDVVNGSERIRKWPEKRGKPKSQKVREQNDWFRQAQWATKYMDPSFLQDAERATQGTPLLPRDVLTMILANRFAAFTLKDGRRLLPTTMLLDVSQALDIFEPAEGQILQRGPEYWEAVDPPAPAGGAAWETIIDTTITSPVPYIDTPRVDAFQDLIITGWNITLSANAYRGIRVSTNGGLTYYATTADYVYLRPDGVLVPNSELLAHAASSAAARTIIGTMSGFALAGAMKFAESYNGDFGRFFIGNSDPITNLRLVATAGNLTSGRFTVIGRK